MTVEINDSRHAIFIPRFICQRQPDPACAIVQAVTYAERAAAFLRELANPEAIMEAAYSMMVEAGAIRGLAIRPPLYSGIAGASLSRSLWYRCDTFGVVPDCSGTELGLFFGPIACLAFNKYLKNKIKLFGIGFRLGLRLAVCRRAAPTFSR